MKLEKTASESQKITISKAEWLHIGKQAGWINKKAAGGAVNDPRSLKQEMNAAINELNHMTGLLSLSQQYANTPGELFRSGKGLYGGCQVDALQTLQNSNVKIDEKGTQWIGVNSSISPVLSKWWAAVKMAKTSLLDQAGNPTKNNPLDVNIITDAMNSIKSLRTELERFNKLVVLNSSERPVKIAEFDGLSHGQTGVWQDQFSRLLQDLTNEHEQLRHLTNYEERFDRVKQMIALANKALQSLEKHKQDIWKQIEPTWRPIPANIKLNNP